MTKEFDYSSIRYTVKNLLSEKYIKNGDLWIVDTESEEVFRELVYSIGMKPLKVGDSK